MKPLLIIVITSVLSCTKNQSMITVNSTDESLSTITATGEITKRCFTGGMLTGTVTTHHIKATDMVFICSILGVDTISRMQLSPVNGTQDFTLAQGEGGYCDNLPKLKLVVNNKVLDHRKSTCKSCKAL